MQSKIPGVILFLGIVSLFADITYEGGRSILGPYMNYLKASGTIIGVLTVGELVMYFSRGFGGYLASLKKTPRAQWGIIFTGYAINLFSIPLLAYSRNWHTAFGLVVLERIGKGLRTPARDAIISDASRLMGRGKGFAIHEVLDQVGAVLGPLYVGLTLMGTASYRDAYIFLWIPALASLLSLLIAYKSYPKPSYSEAETFIAIPKEPIPSELKSYIIISMVFSIGMVQWMVVSYRLSIMSIEPERIAFLYTLAMLVDAFMALVSGFLYDKIGLKAVLMAPIFALLSSVVFLDCLGSIVPLLGVVFWGMMIGVYESVMRAAIGDLSPAGKTPLIYGLYGMAVGLTGFLGNTMWGFLIDHAVYFIAPSIIMVEILSILLFIYLFRSNSGP